MNDLVSIILPTYNRARLLGRAIRSALAQSYREIQLIVVDDASTDDTEEVVAGFRDSRILYLRNPGNLRASGARNVGIARAEGRYVTFLDSDDEYHPDKVIEQYSKIRNTTLGAVTCGRDDCYGDGRMSTWLPRIDQNALHHLLARDNVGAGAPFLMIPRTVLRDYGILFDEKMSAMEDHDLLIRICQRFEFAYVRRPLVRVNHHPGEHLYSNERSIESHLEQNRKYAELYERDTKARIKNAINLAEKYFYLNKPAEAVRTIEQQIPGGSLLGRLWALHFRTFGSPDNGLSRANLKLLRKCTYIT